MCLSPQAGDRALMSLRYSCRELDRVRSRRSLCARFVLRRRQLLQQAPPEAVALRHWLAQSCCANQRENISPRIPTRRRLNMATMTTVPKLSNVVSHSEWIEARRQFLAKEKE